MGYPAKGYPNATVFTAGCGPTCASMVVENLTDYKLPPDKAAKICMDIGARVSGGTDMGILTRYLEREYSLVCEQTNGSLRLISELKRGRIAVFNVGGDDKDTGRKGVFSDGGHYLVILGVAPDGQLIIADPYMYDGKYDKPHRKAVTVAGKLLYAPADVVHKDAESRSPRYYIFRREVCPEGRW